ncbi:MAG: hypothetical protein JW772_04770 [Candidatus Diapherotrites archaeon]|nr:hypothetical protein [Candidatus Diapherotrites archaeon]
MNSKKILFFTTLLLFLGVISQGVLAQELRVTSFSYDPAPALPGTQMKFFVTLKNLGGADAKDVLIELDLTGGKSRETEFPFSLGTASPVLEIGTIKGGQSATVRYDVLVDSQALNGDYVIKVNYAEKDLPKKSETQTITVQTRNPQIEIIQSSAVEAKAGQTTGVSITIANVGSDNARNIVVGFAEDRTVTSTGVVVERDIIPLGATYQYIENLAPNEQKIVHFSLTSDPDASLKTYMLPVTVEFKDEEDTEYTETRYIGLKLVQDAELETAIGTVSPKAFPGGTSEISFDLFNTGIGPAKFVVANVSTDAGIFANERIFIGTLEADDFDAFKVELNVNPETVPGEYPIHVVLEFKNQYGESEKLEKDLILTVVSTADAQQDMGVALIIAGAIGGILQIIGLIWLARFIYRRLFKRGK